MSSPIQIGLTTFRCDAYQTIAAGSITSSYTSFTNPIIHNWRFIDLNNTTNADVSISFDGTTNNIYMPAGSFRIYDLAANGIVLAKNTTVYVKSSGSPSTGVVTMTGGFQRGN